MQVARRCATATGLALVYLVSDYAWYRALPLPGMTVAQATAVYNASFVFCIAFSVCILNEQLTRPKLAASAVALAGLGLYGMSDSDSAHTGSGSGASALEPLFIVIAAAATYALYEVLYTWAIASASASIANPAPTPTPAADGDCSSTGATGSAAAGGGDAELSFAEINITIGLIGLCHVVFIPIFLVLDSTAVETFAWPDANSTRPLLYQAGLSTGFNWCSMVAIALLGPVMVSLATLLTIPGTMLTDSLLHGVSPTPMAIGGAVCIGIGFAVVTLGGSASNAGAGHGTDVPASAPAGPAAGGGLRADSGGGVREC